VRSSWPERTSQRRTVRSFDAEAMVLPSRENATAVTADECPSKRRMRRPVSGCHKRTLWSSEPEAIRDPSGLKATALTGDCRSSASMIVSMSSIVSPAGISTWRSAAGATWTAPALSRGSPASAACASVDADMHTASMPVRAEPRMVYLVADIGILAAGWLGDHLVCCGRAFAVFATAARERPQVRPRLAPPLRHGGNDRFPAVSRLRPNQVGTQVDERIDNFAAVAQLEVQVRKGNADASVANVPDDLPGLDPLAVLDEVIEQVHVLGHQVVLVLDLHEQAARTHAVLADGARFVEGHFARAFAGSIHAGVDDPAVGNRTHRLAEDRSEVDAFVRPLPLVADITNHAGDLARTTVERAKEIDALPVGARHRRPGRVVLDDGSPGAQDAVLAVGLENPIAPEHMRDVVTVRDRLKCAVDV